MKKVFITMLLVACVGQVSAQWVTQTLNLKPGWNAVFLHVDMTHTTLQDVANDGSNPIQEVWLWKPAVSTMQFVESPQLPTSGISQWASWSRSLGVSSQLQRMIGNAAYLVKVGGNANYTWTLKGKPLPLSYKWTTSGLNLVGFPVVPNNPPMFETFFAQESELYQNAQVFNYVGGELSSSNPARLFALRTTPIRRGEAYWIRSGTVYNRYYSPFEVELQNVSGVFFDDSISQYRIRIRNLAAQSVTVRMQLGSSETPPAGQAAIAAEPPLMVRGALNTTKLTYDYSALPVGGFQQWTLAKKGETGSEVEIILGLNRFQMSAPSGSVYAGILSFKDSLNFSQVDIPVSASVVSKAGLWVGEAEVNQVRNYLKKYQTDGSGNLLIATNGRYVLSSVLTNMGATARAYPLRLIIHNDEINNRALLMQRVYYGMNAVSNYIVAAQESALSTAFLSTAKRISAVHLPWSETNTCWAFDGALRQTSNVLSTVVSENYANHTSNPFLHTYHPDHDNVNATFDQQLPAGYESYTVTREISLAFVSPDDDFESITKGGRTMSGGYSETITILGKGVEQRKFESGGTFTLHRISEIGTLTR